jgi:hypothetical protein
MNKLVIIGIIVAILGVIGFAVPVVTTHHTEDVAKIGDFKVQTKEEDHHVIPPAASGAVLVLGIVLIGAGVIQGRRA